MDGEVIYFDKERGTGFITGRDGNRYVFDRADLTNADRVAKGDRVRFVVDADRARSVESLAARGSRVLERQADTPHANAGGSVPSINGAEIGVFDSGTAPAGEERSVFGHFVRCLTADYANFQGRAPRKEYWSFALIAMALTLIAVFSGLTLDFAVGNLKQVASDSDFEASGVPFLLIALTGLVMLALVVPLFAVTIRRIHDIGLSGWFLLMNLIPSVGSLIILVFTLIPSQRHPNRWGPVPAGVYP